MVTLFSRLVSGLRLGNRGRHLLAKNSSAGGGLA